MATLFGTKTKKEKKVAEKTETTVSNTKIGNTNLIIRPRITEKATMSAGKNIYIFEVDMRANKFDIGNAITTLYKTKPSKIRIVKTPSKVRFVRGKWGKTTAGKKAYVYFPKGTTIEVM